MATAATTERPKGTTTLADLMAAAKVGAIDPNTQVLPVSDLQDELAAQYSAGIAAARGGKVQTPGFEQTVPLSATEHDCGIAGCKHGEAHVGPSQPDRQVKLQCPNCGAVARMTARAIGRTGGNGVVCGGDGATFVKAERRTYGRKAAA